MDRVRDRYRLSERGRPARFLPANAENGVVWRSRGYLPHIDAPNLVQHIVFRLADSLPSQITANIDTLRSDERTPAIDAALDAGYGRRELARPDIALIVQSALLAFHRERYTVVAWCVMPNHVHVLSAFNQGNDMAQVIHSWKSFAAKKANRRLGRTGRFWAPEYFDRFMRDEQHLATTAAYIEANPVKAGLCENVDDWEFSSAWRGMGRRDADGPDAEPLA